MRTWKVGIEELGYEAASKTVDGWMSRAKNDGRVEVPVSVLESARKDFLAEKISDEFREKRYIADPHTTVGLGAGRIIAGQK